MRYLFIGGVGDGLWADVHDDRTSWQLAEKFPNAIEWDSRPGAINYYTYTTTVRTDTYMRETIRCPTGDVTVYVLYGMSPREAGLEVLRRVAKQTEPRLRDSAGRPDFNLKFYLLQ